MRVLFLSVNDWANAGRLLAEALVRVGVDAVSASRHQHGYNYSLKNELWTTTLEVQDLINQAEVVVIMHSESFAGVDLTGKRSAIFCGGTRYRQFAEKLNTEMFNERHDMHLIQTADLLDRGTKTEHWIIPPVDTDALQPKYKEGDGQLIFGHYPRNLKYKGSRNLLPVLRRMEQKNQLVLRFSAEKAKWPENMERMGRCDVYVERMSLQRGPWHTGIWGMTALEAAALGKIVITNDLHRERYEATFGPCPLVVANSPKQLAKECSRLIRMPLEEIRALQMESRRWAVETHGYEAVGNRLKEVLEL